MTARNFFPLYMASLLAATAPAQAQWEGDATLRHRVFGSNDRGSGRYEPSLLLSLGRSFEWAGGDHRLVLRPWLRVDPVVTERSRFDLRDASWRGTLGAFEIDVGFREVFWGAAESYQAVDVINQRDSEGRWPQYQKLGEPMVTVALRPRWGLVELYLLPWFRPRPLAGHRGQLWSSTTVDGEQPSYGRGAGPGHPGWAVRWSQSIGSWDVAASWFSGTARDPAFVRGSDARGSPVLVPSYRRIDQFGAEVQLVLGQWIAKGESIVRSGDGSSSIAGVGGLEWAPRSYFSVFLEYLFDDRGAAATTSYEHDVFLAARLLLQDGHVTAGGFVDTESGNTTLAVTGLRRFAQALALTVDLRVAWGDASKEPRFALEEETSVAVAVRYFW